VSTASGAKAVRAIFAPSFECKRARLTIGETASDRRIEPEEQLALAVLRRTLIRLTRRHLYKGVDKRKASTPISAGSSLNGSA